MCQLQGVKVILREPRLIPRPILVKNHENVYVVTLRTLILCLPIEILSLYIISRLAT